MKESLNFTLYEIFGYLMPGSIATAALSLIFWTVFHGHSPLPLSFWRLSATGFLVALLIPYLLGHIVQAVGNLVLKGVDETVMTEPLAVVAKERLTLLLQGKTKDIANEWLQRVMDECCIHAGLTGDREIFTYREGFYRGSTVATVLFCSGLLTCIITGNLSLLVGDTSLTLSRCELGIALAISGVAVWLLYKRFRRFSRYRVVHVIAGFVALSLQQAQDAPPRDQSRAPHGS